MLATVRTVITLVVVAGWLLAGCDPDDGDSGNASRGATAAIPKPVVMGISPTQVSAGDEIQIIGNNFCAPQMDCRSRVTFEGSYQGPYGTEPVQIEAQKVAYVNAGTLSWHFAPNIPFSQRGQIGSFSGVVKVFNEGPSGQGHVSPPQQVQVVVGPSIVIRRMGPLDGDCGGGELINTVEDVSFIIEAEAVGLQPASPAAPVMFAYTFMEANFQFEGRFRDRFNTAAEDILPPSGAVMLVDRVQSGTTSTAGGAALRNMRLVEQGPPSTNSGSAFFDWMASNVPFVEFDERFAVSGIKTRSLPEQQGGNYAATITVQAADAAGNMATRTLQLRVWSVVELTAGESRKVRDYEPVAVTGCIHGSSPPAQLTYTDQRTETRRRDLSAHLSPKPILGVPTGFLQSLAGSHTRIEAETGIKIEEEVSSAQLNGMNLQVQVLPGQVAVVYRQLTQLEQRLDAVVHSACGQSEDAGFVVLTDWTWGLDVARAKQKTCDPVPQTRLVSKSYENQF